MGMGRGFGESFTEQHHIRAPGSGSRHLGRRCVHRHNNGGLYPRQMRMPRHRLGMISRGHGDHPRRLFRRRHQRDPVGRAAFLEGPGRLQMVVFQKDFRSGRLAQPIRVQKRRTQHRALDPPGGGFNVSEREGEGGGWRSAYPPYGLIHR